MKLLVCDTSNSNCSAGVFEDGKEICYELSFETKTHSETFMPLVHSVMEKAGVKHALDFVMVFPAFLLESECKGRDFLANCQIFEELFSKIFSPVFVNC